jgi:hypothetical protein
MINQVEFEGYLTRAWEYREQRYMRLANHRQGEDGRMASDYITVRIDPGLNFDPRHTQIGTLLHVSGRIVGRDIIEPLNLVVNKSHEGVVLPGELSNLVIRRPTILILATQVRVNWKERQAFPKTASSRMTGIEPLGTDRPGVSINPGFAPAEAVKHQ